MLLEILSFFLIKVNILPNGLTPNLIFYPHEDFTYWHPKNSSFKIATKCWSSKVNFNNYGLKSDKDISLIKTKKRIAILGDSMTENAQLDNKIDFTTKLQKLLPDYEILNFSVSSTGLADHIKIYEKLIKKFDIDYLFYYVTLNDFSDNHISKKRYNRVTYKVYNGKVVEVDANKSQFFKKYNSSWNRFKRDKIIYLKKNLNMFIFYYEIKTKLAQKKYVAEKKIVKKKYLNEKKIVYEFLVSSADKKIFLDVPTLIFLNSDNIDFINDREEILIIKNIYKNKNFYDPKEKFKSVLNEKKLLKEPFLGFKCDPHYSELGAELLANYTFEKFESFLKK